MSLSPTRPSVPRGCMAAVTAITIIADGSCAIAAVASTIRLYALTNRHGSSANNSASNLLAEIRVFDGQRIHGLEIYRTIAGRCILAVFGGKQLTLLQLDESQATRMASSSSTTSTASTAAATDAPLFTHLWTSPTPLEDIIWNVHFLRCSGDVSAGCSMAPPPAPAAAAASNADDNEGFDLAIGYAHDLIEILNFNFNGLLSLVATPPSSAHAPPPSLQCADRSLLYSMCMHGSCRHRLLVIGGTVFSHILIWDASEAVNQASAAATASSSISSSSSLRKSPPLIRPVLHRLTGHEGVIFRVQCSVDAAVIASVSDDRSMRVWRWTATATAAAATPSSTPSTLTTVASSLISPLSPQPSWTNLIDPTAGSFVCALTTYGHKARVWRCIMPREWNVIITASEDSTCCIWHASTGECLTRFSGQRGGLWSLGLHESTGILAIGAGEGSIRLYTLSPNMRRRKPNDADLANCMDITSTRDEQQVGEQMIVLRVPNLLPAASHTPAISSPSTSNSTATAAVAVSAAVTPPSKRAKIDSSDSSAVGLAVAAAVLAPSDDAIASAAAAISTSKQPKQKKAGTAATPPAAEICRELLLDVDDSGSSSLFMLTSFGRILRVQLLSSSAAADDGPSGTSVASPAASSTTTTAAAAGLFSRATLLHSLPSSAAALVSLALSSCKTCLAVGDQRGNLLLVPTQSSSSSSAPIVAHVAHHSACAFMQFIKLDSVASTTTMPNGFVGHLLTGDAIGEVKLWTVSLGSDGNAPAAASASASTSSSAAFQLTHLLTFRLPVKARLTCALLLPSSQMRSQSSQEDGDDDSSESDEEMVDDLADTSSSSSTDPSGNFLLCGDSRGSVYVYFLPSSSVIAAVSAAVVAICRLVGVHERSAVSSLVLDPLTTLATSTTSVAASSNSNSTSVAICSTGRNGSVVEYAFVSGMSTVAGIQEDSWPQKHNADQPPSSATISTNLSNYRLLQRRVHKLSQLSSAESLLFSSTSSSSNGGHSCDRLVCGFHSQDFILWNLTQNSQVQRWKCGGASRSWAFKSMAASATAAMASSSLEAGYVFCYTRHGEDSKTENSSSVAVGEVVIHSPSIASSPSPSSSAAALSASSSSSSLVSSLGCAIHARLTTSIAIIPLLDSGVSLTVTGSEDNTIKIYSVAHNSAGGGDAIASSSQQQSSKVEDILPFHAPITCIATIVDHPDVVRAVAVSPEINGGSDQELPPSSYLIFSAGGLSYLHCTRIQPRVVTSSSPATVLPSVTVSIESLGAANINSTNSNSSSNNGKKTWISRSAAATATATTVAAALSDDRLLKLDLRIMCVTAFPVPDSWMYATATAAAAAASSNRPQRFTRAHAVVCGNSAGILQFFLFDSSSSSPSLAAGSSSRFHLIGSSSAHAYTILSLTHLSISAGDDTIVFSGATDGRIMIWSMRQIISEWIAATASNDNVAATSSFSPSSSSSSSSSPSPSPSPLTTFLPHALATFSQHQSGVDCMCATQLSTNSFVLFSGGDDEAISMIGGRIDRTSSASPSNDAAAVTSYSCVLNQSWTTQFTSAHLSAVRSLTLNGDRLYSVGYDQRVRVWRIECTNSSNSNNINSSNDSSSSNSMNVDSSSSSPPTMSLRRVGECMADVWDATSLRVVDKGNSATTAAPLLAVAGQGMQLLHIKE